MGITPKQQSASQHQDNQDAEELGQTLRRKLFIERMERKLELKKSLRNARHNRLVQ